MLTSQGRSRVGFTLIELLVVIAIIGLLIGLLLPAVQKTRDVVARAECQNKARQLGLALHQYHDTKKAFPAGHRSFKNRDGMGFSGWPLAVTPYLEQASLYDRAVVAYGRSRLPFKDPPHMGLHIVVGAFVCP